jgi:hypothetical protein
MVEITYLVAADGAAKIDQFLIFAVGATTEMNE